MRIHLAVTVVGAAMLTNSTSAQQLSFQEAKVHGRQAYVLENGRMRVAALQGGGHLAEIRLRSSDPQKSINPMRVPHFPTIEPWQYEPDKHDSVYGGRADRWLTAFEKPMLALIEGYCVGGGLATALAADVRFATPDSRFGIPAAKLGLGYDYPGLAKLARLVGPSRARDILFSARLMNAAEAKAIGLVNFVVERDAIEAETIAYARAIAGNAPLTVKAVKAALNAWEAGADSADLERVKRLVDDCFDSDDYKEGRRAFMQKRPPRFKGG